MSKGVFITATGTDVGKTFVTALIAKKLSQNGENVGYYKAALSGAEVIGGEIIAGDAKHVADVAGIKYNTDTLVSYIYKTAVSPHLAANLEGNPVCLDVIKSDFGQMKLRYDYLCVEGSGGIICPLRIDKTQVIMLEDVIKALNLDVVIVASCELGTINATVLTVNYIRSKGIEIKGIFLNNYDEHNFLHVDNRKQLESLSAAPILACIKSGDNDLDISIKKLKSVFKEV